MTDLDLDPLATGRPVRLVPTAPGFWRLTMGVVTARLFAAWISGKSKLIWSNNGCCSNCGRMNDNHVPVCAMV